MVYNIHMERYNLYLSEPQLESLKKLSKETGLSVSEHVRRAIDGYLAEKDVKVDDNRKIHAAVD